VFLLVSKHRDVVLHGVDYTHIHATHILLKAPTLRRLTILTLTCYWLAASKLRSQNTHTQQFGNNFVVSYKS